jgi:surfactin synthase thioesterase subunit
MNDVVNDIFHRIRNSLDTQPYAFFGYSMGSWIAYELIRKALKSGYRPPVHAFFAAKDAPHIISKRVKMHLLEHDEFVERIVKLGGTPEGLFENSELMEIFVNILRTDYEIVETYKHCEKDNKINCNISVLYGTQDNYPKEDIEAWADITKADCSFSSFDDGHFFINNKLEDIINIINSTL